MWDYPSLSGGGGPLMTQLAPAPCEWSRSDRELVGAVGSKRKSSPRATCLAKACNWPRWSGSNVVCMWTAFWRSSTLSVSIIWKPKRRRGPWTYRRTPCKWWALGVRRKTMFCNYSELARTWQGQQIFRFGFKDNYFQRRHQLHKSIDIGA